jgi:hypothetical protein
LFLQSSHVGEGRLQEGARLQDIGQQQQQQQQQQQRQQQVYGVSLGVFKVCFCNTVLPGKECCRKVHACRT